VTWEDENLNEPAPLFTTYALGLTGSSIGTVAETSPAALTDKWGSMTINQPTVCTTNASACTVASPTAIASCRRRSPSTARAPPRASTRPRRAAMRARPPSSRRQRDRGTTAITPQIEQSISVTATQSQNNSPFAVTIELEYASGAINATGKYNAGDPALTVIATLTQGGGIPTTTQP